MSKFSKFIIIENPDTLTQTERLELLRVGANYTEEGIALRRSNAEYIRCASLKEKIKGLLEAKQSNGSARASNDSARANKNDFSEFQFTTKPYRHQMDALKKAIRLKKCGLLMEMGTGKSKVALDYCEIQKTFPVLIIAPNTIVENWVQEIKIHTGGSTIKMLRGSKKKRLEALGKETHYTIINYEGILSIGDELRGRFKCVICDESSRIKNPKAKTTKKVLELFEDVEYKLILSGTPITQSPIDIYTQFYFLDKNHIGIPNWYAFRNYYCVMGGYGGYEVLGYKHLEQLKGTIEEYSYICKKQDCLDLPDKIYEQSVLETVSYTHLTLPTKRIV